MNPDRSTRLKAIHAQLIKLTQAWALRKRFDPDCARELRRQAVLINHAHYLENIPTYRRFADQEGIGQLDQLEPIKQHLMLPDDIFKSYDQRWLDENNFSRMNSWLSEIHHRRMFDRSMPGSSVWRRWASSWSTVQARPATSHLSRAMP